MASVVKTEGAIDYAYDDHGALESMSYKGHTVLYGYDAHGRIASVESPSGEWRYAYDSAGRKKSVENVAANLLETWDHDALGRLEAIRHYDTSQPADPAAQPSGDIHALVYEAEYMFGPSGRRVGMIERRFSDYDTSETEWKETVWLYEYDGLGRLVTEMAGKRTRYSSVVLQPTSFLRHVKYEHDEDSNRTKVLNVLAQEVEVHAIDPGSQRLMGIQRGPDTDLDGVIDGTPDSETVYSYTAAGELAVETTINNVTGAVLQKEYFWSAKGELLQVDVDDEDADTDPDYTIQYAYDDRGTLVERKSWLEGQESSAVTERYLVDYENPTGYSQVLAEMRAEGDGEFVLARVNTYSDDLRAESTLVEHAGAGAGGGGPPAHALVPGVQFPLRDALGTVRASAGFGSGLTPGEASINDYRYSAFGLPLGENFAPADASTRGSLTSQSAPSPWAFTGQRIDPATGLQYHRARWLDMALGRWASVDPVWDWPGNLGHQGSSNVISTLNTSDPLGLFSLGEVTISGAIQTILAQFIVPAVAESLIRATLTAAGVDPAQLVADGFSKLASFFGLATLLDKALAAMGEAQARGGLNLAEIKASLEKFIEFIIVLSIVTVTVQFLLASVELFLRRSVSNAVEFLDTLIEFTRTLMSASIEFKLEVNPSWHHIFPVYRKEPKDLWRSRYQHVFAEWFNRAGLPQKGYYAGKDKGWRKTANVFKEAVDQGRGHSREYYEFLYDLTSKKIHNKRSLVRTAGGDPKASFIYEEALTEALEEMQDLISKNREMLSPTWNGVLKSK